MHLSGVRRLSIPAWAYSSKPVAAGLLLWAPPAEYRPIDRLLHGAQQRGVYGGRMRAVPRCQRT